MQMPPFACDCHMHVFGEPSRYPPAAVRAYTPKPATLAQWRAMAAPLGIERVVLVQPSAYGTDNACMLDALRGAGAATRGVAVIDDATPDAALAEMQALGVRGVRLNMLTSGRPDAGAAAKQLRHAAARIAPLGWHLQIFAEGDLLATFAPLLPDLGVPVVLDHMAGTRASEGLDQPGLGAALRLLESGACWIKLSGADRVAATREAFGEAMPIMGALIAANPDRMVWGSDWPHIGPHGSLDDPQPVTYLPLDERGMLAVLAEAAGDKLPRILADNPAALYGWA